MGCYVALRARFRRESVLDARLGISPDDPVMTDGELEDSDLNADVAVLLRDAGPWGQGFPEPLFEGRFELLGQRPYPPTSRSPSNSTAIL